ncbi:MAG TPA: response regulator, partial [Verrucomicrobiae bacterium]|nr:response regulator [Verrucomicrobiae bacterium]
MKANILVIDDDAEIRELLVQILTRAGHQVSQVKDAASLKEGFARLQPDVVLLDYKLPDATGLDLLPLIKKEWPEAEVIMMTGHATYDVAVEAIKRGAFHFQEKPFDPESLLNLIKRAVEIRTLREAVSTANAIFACDAMKNVVRT